ncbi:MAG: zinc metalloprotease HtpX [Actinomycetota bacterium]
MAFRNTMKTAVLLAAIGGLLVLVGSALGGTGGAVIGLVLGLVIVGGSYWFSDRIAVRAAGAHEVSIAEAPRLHATVAELAERAGLPKPRVYVSPAAQPNAFATGRNPRHAAVAVTEGLLTQCPPDEVRGVLAHELAHIRNRDILIGSVAAAVATGISFVANMALFAGMFGGGDDEDGPSPAVALLMALLAPMAATVLQMALSRSREFEADRVGATIAGDPEPLARALERLDRVAQVTPFDVNPAQASAYIVNPLTGRKVSFARLFLTHPPVEERVERLRSMADGHARSA